MRVLLPSVSALLLRTHRSDTSSSFLHRLDLVVTKVKAVIVDVYESRVLSTRYAKH